MPSTDASLGATRAFALAGIALAGFLFSLTPLAERLDNALLDVEWSLLRKFVPKAAPEDILIVGVDDASVRAIATPPGLWHEPVGRALERIARADPRAIGIDLALPERSYEGFQPGIDQRLLRGLVAARNAAVVVASLSIDSRTHAAHPIAAPFLAALGEEGLGIGLVGRDSDGTTRRFSLAIPTEDGAFPTLAGRLCRRLSRSCSDGLIDYALGMPFRYVPLHEVLAARDEDYLRKLFRDRIVLIGDVRSSDRVAVSLDLSGWEASGRSAPSVVVHAQSLRTAMAGAPVEAAQPLAVVLVALATLVGAVRKRRLAAATALLAGIGFFVLAVVALRGGAHFGIASALLTLVAAAVGGPWLRRREH